MKFSKADPIHSFSYLREVMMNEGISYIPAKEVRQFKKEVVQGDLMAQETEELRRVSEEKNANLWRKIIFSSHFPPLFTLVIVVLAAISYKLAIPVAFVLLSRYNIEDKIKKSCNVKPVGWKKSAFSEFESEYKGDVVAKLSPCCRCHPSLFSLWVVYHPKSPTRFLMARDEDTGACYYLEAWDI